MRRSCKEEIAFFSSVAVVPTREAVLLRSADSPCGELIDVGIGGTTWRVSFDWKGQSLYILVAQKLQQPPTQRNDIALRETY